MLPLRVVLAASLASVALALVRNVSFEELEGFLDANPTKAVVLKAYTKSTAARRASVACTLCHHLKPEFLKLAEDYHRRRSHVVFFEIESTDDRFTSKYSIFGMPAVLLIKPSADGGKRPVVHFSGKRIAYDLCKWVEDKSGLECHMSSPIPAVKHVTPQELDALVQTKQPILLEVVSQFDIYCRLFAPYMEKISHAFAPDPIHVAAIDGDQYSLTATALGARRYPHFVLIRSPSDIRTFPHDNDEDEQNENRDLKMRSLVQFVNSECGLHRRVDGRLADGVGVVPELEATVRTFLQQPLVRQLMLPGVADTTYRHLMQLVLDYGPRHLHREAARLRLLLGGSCGSRAFLDECQQRLNVLQAVFLPQLSTEKQAGQ